MLSGPFESGLLFRQERLLTDAGVGTLEDLAEEGLRDLVLAESGGDSHGVGSQSDQMLVGLHGQLRPPCKFCDHIPQGRLEVCVLHDAGENSPVLGIGGRDGVAGEQQVCGSPFSL